MVRTEVSIPRASEREDPNLFVAVNGVNYLLPRGARSLVPHFVAKELSRAERASDALYACMDGMRKQSV